RHTHRHPHPLFPPLPPAVSLLCPPDSFIVSVQNKFSSVSLFAHSPSVSLPPPLLSSLCLSPSFLILSVSVVFFSLSDILSLLSLFPSFHCLSLCLPPS